MTAPRVRARLTSTSRTRLIDARLVEEYLTSVPAASKQRQRSMLAQWQTWCRTQRVGLWMVRRSHVEAYLAELREAGLAPSTCAGHLSAVAGLYTYAHSEGHLDRDPTAGVRRPRVARVSRGTWLSREEMRDVLDAADRDPDPVVTALTWLLGVHGCRIGEVLAADVTDLDAVQDRTVLTLTRKGYAGTRTQLLLAEPVATRVLLAVGSRQAGPILTDHAGGRLPWHAARRIIGALAIQVGITREIAPHSLRRTFVTLGMDAGITVRDLMASTGHRRPDMIHYYDRGRDAITRDGGDQLAAWLDLAPTPHPPPPLPQDPPRLPGGPVALSGPQRQALARLRGIEQRRTQADRVDAVADLATRGLSVAQIARAVGLSEGRVAVILRERGLPRPGGHDERLDAIRRAAAAGLPLATIAAQVDRDPEWVRQLINAHAMSWPRRGARTSAARRERTARAQQMHADGASVRQIATMLDVAEYTVRAYLRAQPIAQPSPSSG